MAPQEIAPIGLADSGTGIRGICFWTGFCPSSSAPRPVLKHNRHCPRLFSQGRPSTNYRLGGRKREPSDSGSQHCEVNYVKYFLRFPKAVPPVSLDLFIFILLEPAPLRNLQPLFMYYVHVHLMNKKKKI